MTPSEADNFAWGRFISPCLPPLLQCSGSEMGDLLLTVNYAPQKIVDENTTSNIWR